MVGIMKDLRSHAASAWPVIQPTIVGNRVNSGYAKLRRVPGSVMIVRRVSDTEATAVCIQNPLRHSPWLWTFVSRFIPFIVTL